MARSCCASSGRAVYTAALALSAPALWAPALCALGLCALTALFTNSAHGQPLATRVPLSVAIAEVDGARVVPDAWLDARIAMANRIYAPSGIEFFAGERRALDARHADLVTRRDRHALGAELHARMANVFVVRSLRDVDAEGFRQGVHWRPAGRPGAHLVIVTATSGISTLAHELGHFFGNGHSATRGNVMSYERGEGDPFFDVLQLRRIGQSLARFLRSGELRVR